MQSAQFRLHAEIEQRHWWFVGRRRILRALVERLVAPGARIVDVGCGTGANLASLADGYRCLGIDTSAEAIGFARQRFPEVEFRCGFAPEDLGEAAAEAELFLLLDVLEHVADDRQLLTRLITAARPGAKFLITVPADPALWSRHDESFGHYRRYDRQTFATLLSDLPAEVELRSAFNARLYWPIRGARAWGRLRQGAWGRDETDFSLPPWPANGLLTWLFAGERRRLLGALSHRRPGYARGVSLLAVLRRTADVPELPAESTQLSAIGARG